MRRGFTLLEVLVAAGLSTVVLGTGVLMWLNGSKSFSKATQHSSIREQSLLILEHVGRDLDGLIVSQERNPRTGKFYMVQPFELLDTAEEAGPKGKRRVFGRGIRFYVYHRTDMVKVEHPEDPKLRTEELLGDQAEREEPADGSVRMPRLVGRYVEYTTVAAKGRRGGVDLLRNGQKVNTTALTEVRFEREDPVHVRDSMGASPNAVLKITVVPRAGIDGELDEATVRSQDDVGSRLSRTIHLIGYESQYTALLGVALEKFKDRESLDPLEHAVMADAKVWGFLADADDKLSKTPLRYRLPPDLIKIESDKPYDMKSRPDAEFSRADTRPGLTPAEAARRTNVHGGLATAASGAGSSSALAGAP